MPRFLRGAPRRGEDRKFRRANGRPCISRGIETCLDRLTSLRSETHPISLEAVWIDASTERVGDQLGSQADAKSRAHPFSTASRTNRFSRGSHGRADSSLTLIGPPHRNDQIDAVQTMAVTGSRKNGMGQIRLLFSQPRAMPPMSSKGTCCNTCTLIYSSPLAPCS